MGVVVFLIRGKYRKMAKVREKEKSVTLHRGEQARAGSERELDAVTPSDIDIPLPGATTLPRTLGRRSLAKGTLLLLRPICPLFRCPAGHLLGVPSNMKKCLAAAVSFVHKQTLLLLWGCHTDYKITSLRITLPCGMEEFRQELKVSPLG